MISFNGDVVAKVVGADAIDLLDSTDIYGVPLSNTIKIDGQVLGNAVIGSEGNDTITGLADLSNAITAAAGDDTVYGGSKADYLLGNEGSDTIYGLAGADRIYGGMGNDFLYGGDGNDLINGNEGNDFIAWRQRQGHPDRRQWQRHLLLPGRFTDGRRRYRHRLQSDAGPPRVLEFAGQPRIHRFVGRCENVCQRHADGDVHRRRRGRHVRLIRHSASAVTVGQTGPSQRPARIDARAGLRQFRCRQHGMGAGRWRVRQSKSLRRSEALIADYRRDGAVLVRNLLSPAQLRLLEDGIEAARAAPSAMFSRVEAASGDGETVVDQFPSFGSPALARLLEHGPAAELAARMMGAASAQLVLDQLFYKEAGRVVPTPWHQDTPFLRVRGPDVARVWPDPAIPRPRT